MFDSLSSKFSDLFRTLRKKGRITPEDIESTCQELRIALLEADVALSVTEGFVEKIRSRSLERLPEIRQSTNQSEETSKETIPISPSVLSGTLISLMMLVFLFVGFSALKNISSPQQFTPMPLIIGKEK